MKTPVALFVFNRPEHTRQVLSTLEKCARLDECRVYIYCDGPKTEEQASAVEAVRREVLAWSAAHDAEIIKREQNLGLARSIVRGVTELCEQYGRVIVIEDDFALSPDFLDYMLQALDRYEDAPNVYQISGYMFPVAHPVQPDAFFLPLTTTWGWATWARAWKIFDWNATGALAQLADPQVRKRFDLDGTYPYSAMLEDRLAGRNDSWGILWWWAVFKIGGLILYPQQSLVCVGGFDGSGTHCKESADFDQESLLSFAQPRFAQPVFLPNEVVANAEAFARIKVFLQKRQDARKRSIITRMQQGFKKFVQSWIVL